MKLKVKCPTCKREHLVTVPDCQDIMEVKSFACLSCSVVIKYRIGKPKPDKNINEDLFGVFDGGIFSQLFGGKNDRHS